MALRKEMSTGEEELHGVVIVGGGICGLATALALHIKGINSLVLEKAESLRAVGAGITIKANGWRALDQFKVSDELRKLARPLTGIDMKSIYNDKVIDVPYRGDCRCLKRSDIVETMARHLPEGSIRFGCKVEAISLDPITRYPIVSTSDGSTMRTKVLIGCDGSNSMVAKFLDLKSVRFLPLWAARGLTTIPHGHNFRNRFLNLAGNGITFRVMPIDDKIVYFSVIMSRLPKECANNNRDPAMIRQLALQAMQEYPEDILEVVRRCDIESMSLVQLCYRAPWNLVFQSFQEGRVTVAGDAMHAMGNFIGQGGSASLEDTLVVARCLAHMVTSDKEPPRGFEGLLTSYVKERKWRVLKLSVQSFLYGQLMIESSNLKKVFIKAVLKVLFKSITNKQDDYECGSL